MKKLFAIAIMGLAALTVSTERASAGWIHGLCCRKCTVAVHLKQYNAFSQFCCENPCSCLPQQNIPVYGNGNGCGNGGGAACCMQGGGSMGELPAAMQGYSGQGMVFQGAPMAPQGMIQAAPMQAWPSTAPMTMARPTGVPSYSPSNLNYAPAMGR
jgi:hypothetical protein